MRFITKTFEYNEVYRNHRRYEGKYFRLLVHYLEKEEDFGLGIVVRSKVGRAVVRNKIKRRIKGYLRNRGEFLNRKFKAVIITKDEAGRIGWQDLCLDLDGCFSKIKGNSSE